MGTLEYDLFTDSEGSFFFRQVKIFNFTRLGLPIGSLRKFTEVVIVAIRFKSIEPPLNLRSRNDRIIRIHNVNFCNSGIRNDTQKKSSHSAKMDHHAYVPYSLTKFPILTPPSPSSACKKYRPGAKEERSTLTVFVSTFSCLINTAPETLKT